MTEHPIQNAIVRFPTQPSRQRAAQFRGIHLLDTDEPLLATLAPNDQAVLRTTGSYEERAQQLGVPVGTLRSRLHRARAKLVALRNEPSPSPSEPH